MARFNPLRSSRPSEVRSPGAGGGRWDVAGLSEQFLGLRDPTVLSEISEIALFCHPENDVLLLDSLC